MANILIRITFIIIVIIISEYYFFQLIKYFFAKNKKTLSTVKKLLLFLPFVYIAYVIGLHLIVGLPYDDFVKHRQLFWMLNVFMILYVPMFAAAIVLILGNIIGYIASLIIRLFKPFTKRNKQKIRYYLGTIAYVSMLSWVISGFFNTNNFIIKNIELPFNQLPTSFDGFKLMQISDLHIGSFSDTEDFKKVFSLIQEQKPDAIVLTGDAVNVTYKELLLCTKEFSQLQPPYGKYSVLGNHDIGDYFSIKHPENKEGLTTQLILTEKAIGFTLLIDSAVYIKKGSDSIALLGVNNSSGFPFKAVGNLPKALKYTQKDDFKILLSHDPDHWTREIISHTNISLTLSGHTHAAQFALLSENFSVSPIYFKYKHWYGLYENHGQYLYVNPGLGFSGFSGRIGVNPEITCFTLRKKK